MRHISGLWVLLFLLVGGEGLAAGNNGPPCRATTWIRTGSMTTPRLFHAAALLPSGKVLVAGGSNGAELLATAELYDPVTGTWSATGSMSVPRITHTLTVLKTGKVLVVGGANPPFLIPGIPSEPPPEPTPEIAELYDPETGQWTPTGALPMSAGRAQHTATLLPTGEVLVAGGDAILGPDCFGLPPGKSCAVSVSTAFLYDPASGEWHTTGRLPDALTAHAATPLASGGVLVTGGLHGSMDTVAGGDTRYIPAPTVAADTYDPVSGTWSAGSMLSSRWAHTATLLLSGDVLVAGGQVPEGGFPLPSFPDSDEAELFHPATGIWRRTGSLFAARADHTATRLPSGRVLVVGGNGPSDVPSFLRSSELFDPDSETWSDTGCTNDSRRGHTATLLGSGAVLVAGGDFTGDTASAELYGIFVSPAQVSLAPGASRTFSATGGSGQHGSSPAYVWSFLKNESGATLTASGTYQAGSVGGVTDVIQVMDAFANSATATVNVVKQAATVSSAMPQAKSVGCGSTGGAALPMLGMAVLVLLGWRSVGVRRPPMS